MVDHAWASQVFCDSPALGSQLQATLQAQSDFMDVIMVMNYEIQILIKLEFIDTTIIF